MNLQSDTLPIGSILKSPKYEYRVEAVLGKGGFGITYLVSATVKIGNVPVKVKFAVKEHFLSNDCERDAKTGKVICSFPAKQRVGNALKDFLSEATRLSRIGADHPNLVKVNEVFEANGTAYYVMEYLEGESLRSWVESHGRLSEKEMVKVMNPIIKTVEFLHHSRITHLDIKPDNIMLARSDDGDIRPVLIDFGLAKHYDQMGRPTSTINTLGCSDGFSPIEQYAGITTFSPSADIYALGATMWFCLTGRQPGRSIELEEGELVGSLPTNVSEEVRDRIASACRLRPKFRNLTGYVSESSPHVDNTLSQEAQAGSVATRPLSIRRKFSGMSCVGNRIIKRPAMIAGITIVIGLMVTVSVLLFSGRIGGRNTDDLAKEMTSVLNVPFLDEDTELYGFLNMCGDTVIPPAFQKIGTFCEGLMRVKTDGKYGYIDKKGKMVIPARYRVASDFSEGVAIIGNKKYGAIDKIGKYVIDTIYEYIDSFKDGVARVRNSGKYGLIDKKGNYVTYPQYDYMEYADENMMMVRIDRKYGYIDLGGNLIVPPKYESVRNFSEGLARIEETGKYGYIDKSGNIVVEPEYDWASLEYKDGLAFVRRDQDLWYIDRNGHTVIHKQKDNNFWERFGYNCDFSEGLASFYDEKTNRYGYIGKKGEFVIAPQFREPHEFSEGYAAVKYRGDNDSWVYGYINRVGTFVIMPKFSYAEEFKDGLARVRKVSSKRDGFVDKYGVYYDTPVRELAAWQSVRLHRFPGVYSRGSW